MSRLTAISFLCLALSAPALATEDVVAPADESVDLMEPEIDLALDAVSGLEDLPPEILERLDPDDLATLLVVMAQRQGEPDGFFDTSAAVVGAWTAIAVPIGLFLAILLGLTAALVFRYRKHGQLQETLRLMIEKGAEIPPELIAPPDPPYRDLRRGVILVGVGLAVAIFFGLEEGFAGGEWALGLIPGFIGAGYLLIWRISRRSESG